MSNERIIVLFGDDGEDYIVETNTPNFVVKEVIDDIVEVNKDKKEYEFVELIIVRLKELGYFCEKAEIESYYLYDYEV